jgi:sugar lactone lactonase YvrE
MFQKTLQIAFLCWSVLAPSGEAFAEEKGGAKLEIVADLVSRPAGLAVAPDGRVFVTNHPADDPEFVLGEIKDKKFVPYPSEEGSRVKNRGGKMFSAAMAARTLIEGDGQLVVLDMGGEKTSAKLTGFDLGKNVRNLDGVIARDVMTPQSALRDFAYDWDKYYFFVTDNGNADPQKPAQTAVLVYTVGAGMPRRILEGFFSDLGAITIDPQREWLYFASAGAGKVYRAPVTKLIDVEATDEDIRKAVEVIGDKPASTGGMTIDAAGNIYFADASEKAVGVLAQGGAYKIYLQDDRLGGIESFSFGPDGYLYAAIGSKPYRIVKFSPAAPGSIGR